LYCFLLYFETIWELSRGEKSAIRECYNRYIVLFYLNRIPARTQDEPLWNCCVTEVTEEFMGRVCGQRSSQAFFPFSLAVALTFMYVQVWLLSS